MDDAMVARYKKGCSLPEISKEFRLSISKVRVIVLASGEMRSKADAIALAGRQGKLGKGTRPPFTPQRIINIKNSAVARGEVYAKGVSKKLNGYLEITRGPDKGRGVHRKVMEDHLQRKLAKGECVHHIDRNRSNNDISNLVLMTRKDHARLHALDAAPRRGRDKDGRFT